MAGIALICRAMGHQVMGMDRNVYPPMDGILEQAGIDIINSYEVADLPTADLYIVGNAMSRGMPVIEHMLNNKFPFISASQWLAQNVLSKRKVIAVAGTHGKTTTTALLTKMFVVAGKDVGYLIAGASKDFPLPANLGSSDEFIIEADEYDSAFFDKRSKFTHYRPDILLINNLEYDHADIFPDLSAIETQFCHLLRSMPGNAQVLFPAGNQSIMRCLNKEPHSKYHKLLDVFKHSEQIQDEDANAIKPETTWRALKQDDFITVTSEGEFRQEGGATTKLPMNWKWPGPHNAMNLLFASAAATIAGVPAPAIIEAAEDFQGVSRRLEKIGKLKGANIISDFAHHPTAIKASIQAMRESPSDDIRDKKIIAVIELASNSIRLGIHQDKLLDATAAADEVLWFSAKELEWDEELKAKYGKIYEDADELATDILSLTSPDSVILLMSNSSLGNLPTRLCTT